MAGTGGLLLVDPTGDLQARLGNELGAADFVVTAVGTAGECIHAVERETPGVIVSDHDLPDMDGVRLLRAIRLSDPTLPFVLAPTESTADLEAAANEAAVSGYVPPDATAETAVSVIRESRAGDRAWLEREGDLRYRNLVEISPAPINLFDASGESIWGNDAVLDLLGLEDRADLIGRSIFEFIHPDDHDLALAELGNVIERKESVGPTNMRLKRADGAVRHIQVSTAVGRLLGADIGQAVVVDVTDLRSAQEALRAERDFIEETLDTLQDIFYVIDLDGDLLRWNVAMTEVSGYTDEELTTMTIWDLFDEAAVHRMATSLRTVVEAGSDAVETSISTKAGRSVPYEFRGRLLSDGEAGASRIVGIGRDISERKEHDRQLKSLDQWLRHNIRNDINVIQGIASNITEYGTGDVRENARIIQAHAADLVKQADRERDVVNLLTNPPDRRPVDVGALVESAASTIADRHPSAEVRIERLDHVDALAIPALGEAVTELLENAIQHNDAESARVTVAVIDEDDAIVIRLADDGPGIPRSETAVLQADHEIDQLHHNTGMGLLYADTVLQVSGGTIAFERNEPRGSVVRIRLAAAEA